MAFPPIFPCRAGTRMSARLFYSLFRAYHTFPAPSTAKPGLSPAGNDISAFASGIFNSTPKEMSNCVDFAGAFQTPGSRRLRHPGCQGRQTPQQCPAIPYHRDSGILSQQAPCQSPQRPQNFDFFIALCRALDLSVDSLFGLCPPESSPAELQQRLRAAELENARLAEANKFRAELLSARTPIIYILLVACVLQSCALIAYLFIDAHILSAGLIRFGDIGFVAWLLIGLILAAIGSCVWATMRFARKSSKRSADHARPRA